MINVILKTDLACQSAGSPFPGGQTLEARIDPTGRVLVVIHPDNPKFSKVVRSEHLAQLSADHTSEMFKAMRIWLINNEVQLPWPWHP